MRATSRARRRKRRKDIAGLLLVIVAVGAIGALAAASVALRPPEHDPETLCPVDSLPPAHTLILIDATDKLDPRQDRMVRRAVREEVEALPRFGRLSVALTPASSAETPRVVFSACRPGDRSSANPFWENVKALEAGKSERFDEPLTRALSNLRPQAKPGSPILEALASAAADEDLRRADGSVRVVLISDLMQFEPRRFSLYADGADLEAYRRSPGALRSPPDLEGIDVRVVMLERPDIGEAQERAAARFWRPLLEESGARAVEWR